MVRERWLGVPSPGLDSLSFYNVGAKAPRVVWLGLHLGRLYVTLASLPGEFTEYVAFVPEDLGPIPDNLPAKTGGTYTLVLMAKDVGDGWWDCQTDQRIQTAPKDYLLKRLKEIGLKAFAGRVYEVARL